MPANGLRTNLSTWKDTAAERVVEGPLVVVQLDWRDWHRAFVPMAAVEKLHWRRVPGAPRPMLHGSIWCSSIVAGILRHDCAPGDPPHRLQVCILKRHTIPSIYDAMSHQAGSC
jgi:hypothetical protein